MSGTANMAFGRVNAFFVVVHNKHAPMDEEWTDYFNAAYAFGVDHGTLARYLIVTDGGVPNPAQQKILDDVLSAILQKHPTAIRAAIVTPSTFVRGVVTALHAARPIYGVFTADKMLDAYEFLGVPPAYHHEIEALVGTLKAQLRP